jgi:hypothetical protein
MTEKENYLKMLHGEQPDWVPMYTFGPMPGGPPVCNALYEADFLVQFRKNGGGKDLWGVNWVSSYETGNALLPEPNNFIIKDIRKWRDIIKAPSLDGIDWAAMVKKDMGSWPVDRNLTAVALNLHVGFFQQLMAFMGFNDGLMAFHEEPEEVKALLKYLCDFYVAVQSKLMDLVNPDIICDMDDTAAWTSPFVSPEMYREFLLPHHDRQVKAGRDRGLPITMHNCGRAEVYMEDLMKIGVCAWDPAQTSNDLVGIKKKYGNRLCLMGGWDSRDRLLEADVTDKEIIESVRKAMDTLAPGGGYAFCGGFLGPMDDKETQRKNGVLMGEVAAYGKDFYKTH